MTISEEAVREMVRRTLERILGPEGTRSQAAMGQARPAGGLAQRAAVTEAEVLAADTGGRLSVPSQAIITPLAVDTARDRHVTLEREPPPAAPGKLSVRQEGPGTPADKLGSPGIVAVGADHGGFALKEELRAYLGELGYHVVDCGTTGSAPVDYPDFAYAVASLVGEGKAWRGIVVDGAGIGSCMAANKVPGVRAAMCYDHATAVDSREHNDANVLTLGGTLIGSSLARQIAKVWLETEFAGGRHVRRVDKIGQIEKRFSRGK